MKHLTFIILSLFIVGFTGCSLKVDTLKQDSINVENKTLSMSEEEQFLNEFEDEIKVEKRLDPLSRYNRIMTNFNDGAFEYVISPVARGYQTVVHKEIRISVGNFFHNILYPIRLINNLLQGKVKNSGEETGRFIINSTIGILGLFDPAKSYFGLEAHDEDFGQTLGFYGVGAGPHIVLPLFGPSNLRDTFSMYPDYLLNPLDYDDERSYNLTNNYGESLVLKAYSRINHVSLHEGKYEKIKENAIDLYPFLRDVYEQHREQQIKE